MHPLSPTNFPHAAQQAQQWVNELADDLGCSEVRALGLLKSVLHALRDWLSPEEMADLSAQLPLVIRGLFFEGWNPHAKRRGHGRKPDFVQAVEAELGFDSNVDWATSIRAVFRLLDRHVSAGEIRHIRHGLKKSLRRLWTTAPITNLAQVDGVVRVLS